MNAAPAVCVAHHWLIESPAGPTCEGVCRKCNARRIFPTSANESAWQVWRTGGMSPENTAGNYSKWLPL